jgi:GMP synthase (glutamine-hydrolysing)
VLIHEAIGDQLTCVFVDHGLMRQNEASRSSPVPRPLQHPARPRRRVRRLFLGGWPASPTRGQAQVHRRLFIDVFEAEAKKIGGAEFLAQGTLYPDVIESVSFTGGPSVTIKSHHNVGGLPERMNMKLVEPLRELFKDEVRALGRELGLPELRRPPPVPRPRPRHPHPRRVTRESSTSCARPTPSISTRSARPASTTRSGRPSPCCCRCKTVGVMGDGRTYDNVCALRAVTSTDGMTADFYPFDHAFLGRAATRIINEVPRHQPRRLRRHQQAAGHDRVGMIGEVRFGLTVKMKGVYGHAD